LNLGLIFGRDMHLSNAYNVGNKGFLSYRRKNGFSILLVAKRGNTGGFL
jgi:hypothetical protein